MSTIEKQLCTISQLLQTMKSGLAVTWEENENLYSKIIDLLEKEEEKEIILCFSLELIFFPSNLYSVQSPFIADIDTFIDNIPNGTNSLLPISVSNNLEEELSLFYFNQNALIIDCSTGSLYSNIETSLNCSDRNYFIFILFSSYFFSFSLDLIRQINNYYQQNNTLPVLEISGNYFNISLSVQDEIVLVPCSIPGPIINTCESVSVNLVSSCQ